MRHDRSGGNVARASVALRRAEAGRPGPLIRALARYAPYPALRRCVEALAASKSKRHRIAEIRAGLGRGTPGPDLADQVRSLRALLLCVMRSRNLPVFVAEGLSARRPSLRALHALVLELAAAMFRSVSACLETIVRIAPKPLALHIAAHAPPCWLPHDNDRDSFHTVASGARALMA